MFNDPGSRMLAVDVSEPSLAHHRDLRDRQELLNLELMLDVRYGRIGVAMMRPVFRGLSLRQNEPSLLMVKEVLTGLADVHPLRNHHSLTPDLSCDAGLMERFLHG